MCRFPAFAIKPYSANRDVRTEGPVLRNNIGDRSRQTRSQFREPPVVPDSNPEDIPGISLKPAESRHNQRADLLLHTRHATLKKIYQLPNCGIRDLAKESQRQM